MNFTPVVSRFKEERNTEVQIQLKLGDISIGIQQFREKLNLNLFFFLISAYNPKSTEYVRKKYKQKLMRFEEECELIGYLGKEMTARYREPDELPIDFDHKLSVFLALKDIEPTPTWCA